MHKHQNLSTRLDPMSFPWLGNIRIISQEAINHLLMEDLHNGTTIFTPFKLMPPWAAAINFEHFAMPMIHPATGETITSYRKLMNNQATWVTWITVFGKDFGSMCQGDNKTGRKGMATMFVMTPADISNIPTDQTVAYANVVVNHCPPKRRSQSNSYYSRRQPHQLPWGAHHTNSQHYDV